MKNKDLDITLKNWKCYAIMDCFEKPGSQGQLWTTLLQVLRVTLYLAFEKGTNGGRKTDPGVKLTPQGRGRAETRVSALGLFCKREKVHPHIKE